MSLFFYYGLVLSPVRVQNLFQTSRVEADHHLGANRNDRNTACTESHSLHLFQSFFILGYIQTLVLDTLSRKELFRPVAPGSIWSVCENKRSIRKRTNK